MLMTLDESFRLSKHLPGLHDQRLHGRRRWLDAEIIDLSTTNYDIGEFLEDEDEIDRPWRKVLVSPDEVLSEGGVPLLSDRSWVVPERLADIKRWYAESGGPEAATAGAPVVLLQQGDQLHLIDGAHRLLAADGAPVWAAVGLDPGKVAKHLPERERFTLGGVEKARDGDGDGFVNDGKPNMRPARPDEMVDRSKLRFKGKVRRQGDSLVGWTDCARCGGSGRYSGGVCYGCWGKGGKWKSLKKIESELERADKLNAEAAERRKWMEEHPDEVAAGTRARVDAGLDKLGIWGAALKGRVHAVHDAAPPGDGRGEELYGNVMHSERIGTKKWSNRDRAVWIKERVEELEREYEITKGDKPGHPFRGNQWVKIKSWLTNFAGDTYADLKRLGDERARTWLDHQDDPDADELHAAFKAADDRLKALNAAVRHDISSGLIEPDEAFARYEYPDFMHRPDDYDGHSLLAEGGDRKWRPLPAKLWHVTTARRAVEKSGKLKSRSELDLVRGRGLGGGADDTISFTDDPELAQQIAASMLEAHEYASGKRSLTEMFDQAREQGFFDKLMRFYSAMYEPGKPLPQAYQELLRAEEEGRATPGDRLDAYTNFSAYREMVTGQLDPLFMSVDADYFASLDPSDIGIVEVSPANDRAKGVRMGALKEWRVPTGDAVDIDGITTPDAVGRPYRRQVTDDDAMEIIRANQMEEDIALGEDSIIGFQSGAAYFDAKDEEGYDDRPLYPRDLKPYLAVQEEFDTLIGDRYTKVTLYPDNEVLDDHILPINFTGGGGEYAGYFKPGRGGGHILVATDGGGMWASHTLIHEAAHAWDNRVLQSRADLDPVLEPAIEALEKLFGALQYWYPPDDKDSPLIHVWSYALGSMDWKEFLPDLIAYSVTDPDVVEGSIQDIPGFDIEDVNAILRASLGKTLDQLKKPGAVSKLSLAILPENLDVREGEHWKAAAMRWLAGRGEVSKRLVVVPRYWSPTRRKWIDGYTYDTKRRRRFKFSLGRVRPSRKEATRGDTKIHTTDEADFFSLRENTGGKRPGGKTAASHFITSLMPGFGHLADDDYDGVLDQMVGNLEAIHQRIKRQPPKPVNVLRGVTEDGDGFIRRNRQWYDGANKVAERIGGHHGKDVGAAVLALLSPSTPWDDNMTMAEDMINLWDENPTPSQEDILGLDLLVDVLNREAKTGKLKAEKLRTPWEDSYFDTLQVPLQDIDDPKLRALMARVIITRRNGGDYRTPKFTIAPDGDIVHQDPPRDATVKWQSADNIAKAFSVLETPTPENLDAQLGNGIKVRSFYNNIAYPHDEHNDVTIDTHAGSSLVGAPWGANEEPFKKLSEKKSTEDGQYVKLLMIEAFRRMSEMHPDDYPEPRMAQSVLWEAWREPASVSPKRRDSAAARKKLREAWARVDEVPPDQVDEAIAAAREIMVDVFMALEPNEVES